MNQEVKKTIQFRWLGVAGIELKAGNEVLLIDPFLTRFPPWKTWFGHVRSNTEEIAERIHRLDYVLISHAHFDHIMDVPEIIRQKRAKAYGSANACRIMKICGAPKEKIHEIKAGDVLRLGDFEVQVLGSKHGKVPNIFNGSISPALKPPLRARDYKMDVLFTFRISINGTRLMNDPGENPESCASSDILFVHPQRDPDYYCSLMPWIKPRLIIPYHWDDLHCALYKPTRPWPRWHNLFLLSLPAKTRLDLNAFRIMIGQISSGTEVLIPKIFQSYDVLSLLERGNKGIYT